MLYEITPTPIGGGTITNPTRFGIEQIGENKFLFVFTQSSPNHLVGVVVQTSGTSTPTLGTPFVLANVNPTQSIKVRRLSEDLTTNNRAFITYTNSTGVEAINGLVVGVSGLSITQGPIYTWHVGVMKNGLEIYETPTNPNGTHGWFGGTGTNGSLTSYGNVTISALTIESSNTTATSLGNIGLTANNRGSIRFYETNDNNNYAFINQGAVTLCITKISKSNALVHSFLRVNGAFSLTNRNFWLYNNTLISILSTGSTAIWEDYTASDTFQTITLNTGTLAAAFGSIQTLQGDEFLLFGTNNTSIASRQLRSHVMKYTGSPTLQILQSSAGEISLTSTNGTFFSENTVDAFQINRSLYNISNDLAVLFYANSTNATFFLRFLVKP